jgi:hypothetical protein
MNQARSSSPMFSSTRFSFCRAVRLSSPYSAAVMIEVVGSKRRLSRASRVSGWTRLSLETKPFCLATRLRNDPVRHALSHHVPSMNWVRPAALEAALVDFGSHTPASGPCERPRLFRRGQISGAIALRTSGPSFHCATSQIAGQASTFSLSAKCCSRESAESIWPQRRLSSTARSTIFLNSSDFAISSWSTCTSDR